MFGAVEAQTVDIAKRVSTSEPYLLAMCPTFKHDLSWVEILSRRCRAEEKSIQAVGPNIIKYT
jgi:hypothetical protein